MKHAKSTGRKVGKFYISADLVDSKIAPRIFTKLGFVPFRAEYIFARDAFEYTGLSKLFEVCPPREAIPEYEVIVERSTLDSRSLTVTVEKKK